MTGGRLSRLAPDVACVLAPNPGPMTLTGTNSWVLGDPGAGPCVVVDPGPLDDGHLDALLVVAGGQVATVVVTHRHLDHTEGAAELARRAGCGVRAADPAWRVGEDGLDDGDLVEAGGVRLEVVVTPGHTGDSVCLLLLGAGPVRLLTGDTVLGAGSTVIAAPDGDLGAYLASLDRLAALVEQRGVEELLPGHGPVVTEPAAVLRQYREHRRERLEQVRAVWRSGAMTARAVVAQVYPDVLGTPLQRAAEQSAQAQLNHLERTERA